MTRQEIVTRCQELLAILSAGLQKVPRQYRGNH